MNDKVAKRDDVSPGNVWVPAAQVGADLSGCLSDNREFLEHRAPYHIVRHEADFIDAMNKARDGV